MNCFSVRCLRAILLVLLCIGLGCILTAPAQANGWQISVTVDKPDQTPRIGAPTLRPPPGLGRIDYPIVQMPTPRVRPRGPSSTNTATRQSDERSASGGVTLSRDEYEQFQQILRASPATAATVALVNLAAKGTGLLLVGLAWILVLVILRRVFNYWFDEDLYKDKYLSGVVVMMLLYCTMRIVVAVMG